MSENSDYTIRFVEDLLNQGVLSEDGSDGLEYIPHNELMNMLYFYLDKHAKGMKHPSSSSKLIDRLSKAFEAKNVEFALSENRLRLTSLYKPAKGIFDYNHNFLKPTYYYDKEMANPKEKTLIWHFKKASIKDKDIENLFKDISNLTDSEDFSVKQTRIGEMVMYSKNKEQAEKFMNMANFSQFQHLYPTLISD